ncbi:MAG TPA: hypothetical protein VM842_04500 [Nitrospira sp.]|nr:hypothetical protein [Nitrospira sp.]
MKPPTDAGREEGMSTLGGSIAMVVCAEELLTDNPLALFFFRSVRYTPAL